MLGFMHCVDARFGWWDNREAAFVKSQAYADSALELDPTSAYAHLVLGFLGWPEERFDEAVSHARKAVQLAPGAADIVE